MKKVRITFEGDEVLEYTNVESISYDFEFAECEIDLFEGYYCSSPEIEKAHNETRNHLYRRFEHIDKIEIFEI